ncbi:MAG TPA: oligopeptide transporter permease, partial [Skermanella sp.]|nr:oligopeptide transporter permease [Skermanella sp.]
MLTYAARRLLGAIPTLLVILTITFFLVRLAPGGPFDGERTLPAEIERNLAAVYHLDEPLPLQYVRYLGQVLQGDFGPSFKYKDFSVTQLIWSGFPVSLQLGGTAMLLAVVIGTALGAFAALRQNSGLDYGVMGAAMVGIAVPNFVIAPLLTLVLGVHLGV